MKQISCGLILALICISIFNCEDQDDTNGIVEWGDIACFLDSGCEKLLIIAHRGGAEYAPENSIPAIEYAINNGADLIEVDVRHTSDNELVLMHDDTVNRTTNGSGEVSDFTLSEIRDLVIDDSSFDNAFPDLEVPTFSEVLELIKGKVALYLDMKTDRTDLIVAALESADMVEQTVIYSSSSQKLQQCQELNPDIKVIYPYDGLSSPTDYNIIEQFNEDRQILDLDFYEIGVELYSLVPDFIDELHAYDVRLNIDILGLDAIALTGNLEAAFGGFVSTGTDFLQTDYPSLLREYRDSLQ